MASVTELAVRNPRAGTKLCVLYTAAEGVEAGRKRGAETRGRWQEKQGPARLHTAGPTSGEKKGGRFSRCLYLSIR